MGEEAFRMFGEASKKSVMLDAEVRAIESLMRKNSVELSDLVMKAIDGC